MKLVRAAEFRIDPTPPFSFELTLKNPAGWQLFNPEEAYEDGILWTGIHFGKRPVGLKITSLGTTNKPRLRVHVYAQRGFSKEEEADIRALVADCLGANQELEPFYEFARKDSILRHVVDDLYGMHDTHSPSLFNSVILAVCLQMARLSRSEQMIDAIGKRYGNAIEFDGRRVLLQPRAERIARLDPRTLAKECNLGYRAKYLVASARMITGGFPEMSEIVRMPPAEARDMLMELPGIGDYAADIIDPHGGFPIDAWSVDVFGLLFFGREPENRREAIEEVKQEGIRRWGVWSWMAFFYVAQDLKKLSERLGVKLRLQ